MTTALTKPRTASIIVDTDGDGFKIQHMLFIGDELTQTVNWPVSSKPFGPMATPISDETVASIAAKRVKDTIRTRDNRPTSVFITISAAKRMTDEQIAAIQQAALETRT